MTVTIDRTGIEGLASFLGESPSQYLYFAQTFKAGGTTMRSLDFLINTVSGPDATEYRLLITTVTNDTNGFHPGTVLKEVALTEPFDGDANLHSVHVDLSSLALVNGQQYAFVLESFSDADGEQSKAQVGLCVSDFGVDYADGIFSYFSGGADTRAEDFNGNWTETPWDLAFKAVFSNPGAVIAGKGGNDRIDSTHAPQHQSKATSDDDTISGKSGNDRIDAGGGFDIVDGGKGDDRIRGGDDGDLLTGGNGKDKITGGPGEDVFVFSARLTEPADRIKDFTPLDDVIHLSQRIFKVLPLGMLAVTSLAIGKAADSDDHIIYRPNGNILYDSDGVGSSKATPFVKLATAPLDVSYSDFVVVA